MQAEITDHLGYAKHDQAGNNSGNSRNGKTTKALKGDFGELPLETPRDRNGTFEPKPPPISVVLFITKPPQRYRVTHNRPCHHKHRKAVVVVRRETNGRTK